MALALNTGHDLNGLGDYEACIRMDGYRYQVINLASPIGIKLVLGTCLPNECNLNEELPPSEVQRFLKEKLGV